MVFEKAGQAESHQVKVFMVIQEVALHLVDGAVAATGEGAVREAQRSDSGLQAVPAPAARARYAKENRGNVNRSKGGATGDDVGQEPAHMAAKIKRLLDRTGCQPGGRVLHGAGNFRRSQQSHRQRLALVPAQDQRQWLKRTALATHSWHRGPPIWT